MKSFKSLFELTFPEYRERHIFTAKLRIAIFIGFWILYVFFLRDVLHLTKAISLIIGASFLTTTICYYNILKNKLLTPFLFLEMCSDLVAMTTIVYLTWGPESEYYTIYVYYALAAGMFYNHYLTGLLSFFSMLFYVSFLLLTNWGILPALMVHRNGLGPVSIAVPYAKICLLAVFLIFSVYGVKIAQYFTQKRERALQARNKELMALQRMSSIIRGTVSLEKVIPEVILGVLEGLNYDACLLFLFDDESESLRCFSPPNNPLVSTVEKYLNINFNAVNLSTNELKDNSVYRSLRENRLVFRNHLSEIGAGVDSVFSKELLDQVENEFNIKKVVGIPLVSEEETIGAILGFSCRSFVEQKLVHNLEMFANQAAMSMATIKLIEKLRKTNKELIEANRVKSEFLATMSHELRTPLTAIIGFSELLLEEVLGELTGEQKESVAEVLHNGNELLDLINNLLDLAKIDSGKLSLHKANFNLVDMVERINRMIMPLIQRRGHTLQIHADKNLPFVFADEKRIQQVLLNLLSNAIKFTPDNGKIEVAANYYAKSAEARVGAEFLKKIKKHFGDEKEIFVISVRDNGVGIENEKIPHIFEMFEQIDSSISRSYAGTGLGLALVKQFVELHNGLVWVDSEINKGSTFHFVIENK